MPALAQKQDSTAPVPRSVDPATYGPAPAGVTVISPSLDTALVAQFREIIRTSGTLTNSRVYPEKDDEQAKSDLRFMRKHLAPSILATERIKVNWYGEPGSLSFFLSIAKRNPRKAKTEETPATETPATETPATA